MKIVVLDGRPLSMDRVAWAGLDQFGEVSLYEASEGEEIRTRTRGPRY